MKANEAPEKIYLRHNYKGDIGAGWLTFPLTNNDIEYIRTDAFINKACEWFRKIDYDDSIPPFETTEEFIEVFKKAMAI